MGCGYSSKAVEVYPPTPTLLTVSQNGLQAAPKDNGSELLEKSVREVEAKLKEKEGLAKAPPTDMGCELLDKNVGRLEAELKEKESLEKAPPKDNSSELLEKKLRELVEAELKKKDSNLKTKIDSDKVYEFSVSDLALAAKDLALPAAKDVASAAAEDLVSAAKDAALAGIGGLSASAAGEIGLTTGAAGACIGLVAMASVAAATAGGLVLHYQVEGYESSCTLTFGEITGSFKPTAARQAKWVIVAEHHYRNVYWYPFDDLEVATKAFDSFWTTSRILFDTTDRNHPMKELRRGGPAMPYNTIRGGMRKLVQFRPQDLAHSNIMQQAREAVASKSSTAEK